MVLVGLAAAGSAGKASAADAFLLTFTFVDEATRDGIGEGRALVAVEEDEAHGVWPGLAPTRPDGAGRAGNGLLEDEEDQLAC